MSALLPGFEYDIFISYRHKDNKGGHWVTEFVDALKTELEATFKEDISIYFDENPHDGLLETHNIDKSLEGKLKCLIFIPIISQTYCDPKSFAWQHEFCAFNKLAREDQFGMNVKLDNGNVASRILPVKIHDLDFRDKTLLEDELGGALRSIEFIFKAAGVNRALMASDNPEKNFNKTFYRDQINKVANGVKGIVTGLKEFDASKPISNTASNSLTLARPPVIDYKKILKVAAVSLFIILIAGFFILNFVDVIGLPNREQLPLHKLIYPTMVLAVVVIIARQPVRKMGYTLMQIASISVFGGGVMDFLFTLTSSTIPDLHIDFLQVDPKEVSDNLVSLEFALLRTLGTSMISVGIGTWVLLQNFVKRESKVALAAFVAMITVTEVGNSVQMYALNLPFYIYTITAVLMAWIGAFLWWKGDPNLIAQNPV